MSLNNITPLFHSKSQNKYDLNNIELSLTNSIDNSDFVLLKNGTIKKKRKKNSYLEGYLDNKRLNKAISNSNKKRNKSCSNIKTKTNLFYKTNFDGLKHSINSDTNIFNKAQKINIFENVIINNENNSSLKLSYSYNDNKISNTIENKKGKRKYNEMMDIKRKKLDKYENLIRTKNMYKDLWKNLKKKNVKKNIKNRNNPNKKNIPEQLDYTFKEEELKEKIKYDKNNLTITKNDGIEYNPLLDKTRIRNNSELVDKTNKTLKLNLNNLIIFKRQKEYKHYDYLGNNYNYYERNESSERKRIKNENNNEYINIINKIKNEENKIYMRNTYNLKYGYNPEFNIINTNQYGNHKVYVSNNVNYENKKNKNTSNVNHKTTNINMNKVKNNFKNIENITDSIKNNHITFKVNNFNNTKAYISNTYKKEIKEKDEKMKRNRSQKLLEENKLNNSSNSSNNYLNKKNNNSINNNLPNNKSHLMDNNKYNFQKYEAKTIKTNFNYSNKFEENENDKFNNVHRKEIKHFNTDKKYNMKLNNYNYYNANQGIKHYNLRDKCKKEEQKVNNFVKYDYYINNINKKINEKENKIILESNKENNEINKFINYHSRHVNHNFYECKNMNPNKMSINNRNNNNQIITSSYKKGKTKTEIEMDKIKENLNEKFRNINKINNLLNQKNKPIIKYSNNNNSKNNENIIQQANNLKNIKNIPTNKKINKINSKEKLNLRQILKNKRRFHSHSPNKNNSNDYELYNNDKIIDLDTNSMTINTNRNLNHSQSTKILKKIKREKNDIIKKHKIRQYLSEKNSMTLTTKNFNPKRSKSLTRKNSYNLIMPPNDLDEICNKNIKFFKLLNKD